MLHYLMLNFSVSLFAVALVVVGVFVNTFWYFHELNPEWLYPAIALYKFKFVEHFKVYFGRQTLLSRH